VNSFGKKAILLIQQKKKQLKKSLLFLNSIKEFMKKSWLYPSSKELKVKEKNSLEDTLPLLLKPLYLKMAELSKEPPLTNLDKISLKCLILLLKIKKKKNNLLGKQVGDSLPDLLESWFFSMETIKVKII
jgi:hypothetical protein